MLQNKPFIEKIISKRESMNDQVKELAIRNKASPINNWSNYFPYNKLNYKSIYKPEIDGVKLRFRYVTLTVNARHKNK